MAGPAPLADRIEFAEAALECAWLNYRDIDPHSWAKRQEREKRYAEIDRLLERMLCLYDERALEGVS